MVKKSLLLLAWLAVESVPTAQAQTFETVVTLPDLTLGAFLTRPVAGPDGKLYATAALGGANGNGTLLSFAANGTVSKVADFNEATGARPGHMTVGADQKLYMVTASGGKLTSATTGGQLTPVVNFVDVGIRRSSGVVRASDGALYGLGLKPEHGSAIFRYTPEGGFETIFDFNHGSETPPLGGLTEGADGALYGMTRANGVAEHGLTFGVEKGTVFRITKSGSFKTFAVFSPNVSPAGSLVLAHDGNLYGAANAWNPETGQDIIFRMTPAGKLETVAIIAKPNFDLAGSLVVGPGGDLYGLASDSDKLKFRGIFKVSLQGVVTFIKLFNPETTSSAVGLSVGPDGNLYGATGSTLFRLKTSNGAPIANDDRFDLPAVQASVIANDADPNNDPLQIVSVTDGLHGTVTFTPDGTVTYSPGPDFDGGEIESDTFAYTISDSLGGTSTATVTVNVPEKIFRAGAGTYRGILITGGAPKGNFALTLAKNGSFTAALVVDGIKTPLNAAFAADGSFSVEIPRKEPLPPLTVTLQLDVISNEITGSISDGTNNYSAVLSRTLSLYSSARPVPLRGKYTALIVSEQTGPSLPGGVGFARMAVAANGTLVITGKLGDGTPFSAGSQLNSDNTFSLFVRGYSKNEGYVAGRIAFRPSETSEADGLLTWHKPPREKDVRYPEGFTTTPTFQAARYFSPPNNLYFGLPHTATLTVGDKPAKQVVQREGFLLRVWPPQGDQTKVKFDPLTGFFRGTYFDGDFRCVLEGAIYQYENPSFAAGFGLDQNATLDVRVALPVIP